MTKMLSIKLIVHESKLHLSEKKIFYRSVIVWEEKFMCNMCI